MKPIYIILPNQSIERVEPVASWVSGLPELSLLAPIRTVDVLWQDSVSGTPQDWMETVSVIQRHWDDAHGFVVWAPHASLLEAAGTASLLFQKSGKPVIYFSCEYPDMASHNVAALAGIKSRLINALYIAGADLGEVGVLVGQNLYRPSACRWGSDAAIITAQPPIATIDFQLHLQGDFARRSNDLQIAAHPAFETSLSFLSWHPGAAPRYQVTDASAVMVSAESIFWGHRDLAALRASVHQSGLPLIWFSHQPWSGVDWQENEIGISHDHDWWAALVAQFAFGTNESSAQPSRALKTIEHLIRV